MSRENFTKDQNSSHALDEELREAMDKVMARVKISDIAKVAGCSENTLMQARLDPSAKGYRNPPAGLRRALHQVSKERAEYFTDLAKQLRPPKEP